MSSGSQARMRSTWVKPSRSAPTPLLEDERHEAVRRAHREEVHDDRLDGDDERAKGDEEEQEAQPEDDPDDPGRERLDHVDRVGVERRARPRRGPRPGPRPRSSGDGLLAQVAHGVHRRAARRVGVDGQLEHREVALGRRLVADDREAGPSPPRALRVLQQGLASAGRSGRPRGSRGSATRSPPRTRAAGRGRPAWRWRRRGTPAAPPSRSSCRGAGSLSRSSSAAPGDEGDQADGASSTRAARVQRPSALALVARCAAARSGTRGPSRPGHRAAGGPRAAA